MAKEARGQYINGEAVYYKDSTARDMISEDAFSETKAYAVGDYCIYDNVLYKFTTAKAAGAWNASVVSAVTITSELGVLNDNLESVTTDCRKISIYSSGYANNIATISAALPDVSELPRKWELITGGWNNPVLYYANGILKRSQFGDEKSCVLIVNSSGFTNLSGVVEDGKVTFTWTGNISYVTLNVYQC